MSTDEQSPSLTGLAAVERQRRASGQSYREFLRVARVPHRFYDIAEDLHVLVVFAPAETA